MDALLVELTRAARRAAAGIIPTAALSLLVACDRDVPGADTGRAHPHPPGYIVDSIHPPEIMLQRFRAGTDAVTALQGEASLRELLAEFRRAAGESDTTALRALTVTRDEFAWIVYPESRVSRPPFRQPPEVAWMLLQQASDAGLRKLLGRAPVLTFLDARCPDSTQVEGRMRSISGCSVRVQTPDTVRDLRLFGRVVEVGGRWKIMGYDGDL